MRESSSDGGAGKRSCRLCAHKSERIDSVDAWGGEGPGQSGGSAPGRTNGDTAKVLKEPRPSHPARDGYKGTAPIKLAAESGEIDGSCWAWQSIKVMWRQGLDAGDVNIVLQAVPTE